MSYGSILADLTEGLQDAGRKNFSVADSDEAMENIAKPIAKAVYDGVDFSVKGSATVAQINAMQGMEPGDAWAVKDNGTVNNPDGSAVAVTAGDLVRWDGEKWSVFLHIDLTGYVTDEELAAAVASEAALRNGADAEIITSLEDETTARRLGDELLQQQIEEVAVQTNWDEDDSSSLAYLQNRPAPITTAEIDALFI